MNRKVQIQLWLGLLLVTILAFTDFQYFSEVQSARAIPLNIRRIGHISILILILVSGYWGWYKHPLKWPKRLWAFTYILGIVCLAILGIISKTTGILDKGILDRIYEVRLFFCSPLPYLMLLVLTILAKRTADQ